LRRTLLSDVGNDLVIAIANRGSLNVEANLGHFLDRTRDGFVVLVVLGDEGLLRRAVTTAKNRAL
jgi:hypothetical protein